jgi:hypothetical protein
MLAVCMCMPRSGSSIDGDGETRRGDGGGRWPQLIIVGAGGLHLEHISSLGCLGSIVDALASASIHNPLSPASHRTPPSFSRGAR